MRSSRPAILVAAVLTAVVMFSIPSASAQSRSVGQVIDDTTITTEIKAKLAADKISNLTKIGVSTRAGVVTLTGSVEAFDRQMRAAQIAGSVKGVREVVNSIQVTAPVAVSPPPPAPPQPLIDATGVVARVDPAQGTVTLQDGRVLRMTDQTIAWQPTVVQALRPGAHVLLRGAAPVTIQPNGGTSPSEWRMGTVRSVDRSAYQMVLTDGTIVRVAASTNIHRGPDRLALEQIAPGSEIVIGAFAMSGTVPTEGSALPGPTATSPILDASEINVVWMPSAGLR